MRAADRGQARAEAGETDEALVARAIRGDRRSFDELYERHVDTVWRWWTAFAARRASARSSTESW